MSRTAVLAHVRETPGPAACVAVWQGSAVPSGVTVDEHAAPAVDALLGLAFVVVGRDEEHAHAIAEPGAPARRSMRSALLQLLVRRQQLVAVQVGPRVVLRVGQLEVLGAELGRHADDAVDVVDVQAVDHHVHHHRPALVLDDRAATLFFSSKVLVCERKSFISRVESWNDSCTWSSPAAFSAAARCCGQADARGEQVGVVAQPVRLGDDQLRGRRAAAARRPTGRAARRRARAPRAARAASRRCRVRLCCCAKSTGL